MEVITHAPGSADFIVSEAGDYEISFSLYFSATLGLAGTFEIQSNTSPVAGGSFSQVLTAGLQVFSGSIITTLAAGDSVRIIFTALIALGITITGDDVSDIITFKKFD